MVSREVMKGVFEKSFYTSKISFVVLLVILAFINGHAGYIASNPKMFAYNSIIVPLAASLATLFMGWNRHSSDIPSKVFIVFLFVFFVQVFSELSGFYAYTGHDSVTKTELKKLSSTPLIATGFFSLALSLFFLVLAIFINQPFPVGTHVNFFTETVVFTLLLTFSEYTVLHNHGVTSTGLSITSNMIVFAVTQVILQKGGFYERVFKIKTV